MKDGRSLEDTLNPRNSYFVNHIANISETDFWSAWGQGPAALRRAVRLGKAGKRAQAYLALAEYHAGVLGGEWEYDLADSGKRTTIPAKRREISAKADQAFRGDLVWKGQVFKQGKKLNFNAPFGASSQYGVHYLTFLWPLVDRLLVEGRPGDMDRILDIVKQNYDQRNSVVPSQSYSHPFYNELACWAKTFRLLPSYMAMLRSGRVRADMVEIFMKTFLCFGRALLCLQESGYRSGNWQLVGSTGLFRLGAVFPELREAASWRRRAVDVMLEHARRDFFPDGGHKERCWSYGWMSLKGVVDFHQVGKRTGRLLGPKEREIRRLVERGFRWFTRTMAPTGICPAYGDGDLFRADEILDEAKKYLPARELVKPERNSVMMASSGYAVMRDGSSSDSRYLNVNFGPTGGGHTHQDLLDFNVWAFGEPLIEEMGFFDTYDQPLNPFFRCPEAHNQVVMDHIPMDRWSSKGESVAWRSGKTLDYFSARHDAFRTKGWPMFMGLGTIHRRILFVKRGGYWIVYDVVRPTAKSGTMYAVSSWLHSPWRFRKEGKLSARLKGKQAGCIVAVAENPELRRIETGVDVSRSEVTAERLYPERHSLRIRAWGGTSTTGVPIAMLIYPYAKGKPRVGIRQVASKGAAETFEVRTPAGTDLVTFGTEKKTPRILRARR